MLGIYIDVQKQELRYVSVPNSKAIASAIGNGCELFCCPVELPNGDVLHADDEATLREHILGGFFLPNMPMPIAGNAIILGTDPEGYIADAESLIEHIEDQIVFIDGRDMHKWTEYVLNAPNELVIQ